LSSHKVDSNPALVYLLPNVRVTEAEQQSQ
jgi:hypothetical protein